MVGASLVTGLLMPLESGGGELASWQIALVAFAFVAYVLVIAAIVERWEVRLHA